MKRSHIFCFILIFKGQIKFKDRPDGGINHEKAPFAKPFEPIKDLSQIIDVIKPSVLIG